MLLISSSETKGWRGQTGEEAQSDKALEITRDGVELLEPPRRLPAAIKVRRVVLKYSNSRRRRFPRTVQHQRLRQSNDVGVLRWLPKCGEGSRCQSGVMGVEESGLKH
jgi:hypothetical protein